MNLFVKLEGQAKNVQGVRGGTYILSNELVNKRRHWIQENGKNALWYDEINRNWKIGSLSGLGRVGSTVGGLMSHSQFNSQASMDGPENCIWDFYDGKHWKLATMSITSMESHPENTRKQPIPVVDMAKRPKDSGPENEMKTLEKRQKLDDSLSRQKIDEEEACWLFKIIKCKDCKHFARHPDASSPLVIENVPNIMRPCVKKECSHVCFHMIQKIANLLIINCNELQHLSLQMTSNKLELNIAEEVKDDHLKFYKCSWKNCSNNCSHMISAKVIQRCQQKCKSFHEISKLGQGGFGSVWKMRTPCSVTFFNSHPIVAMKRIKNSNEKAMEEVEILKKCDHKNIVKYLNSYLDESTRELCIYMEFCGNGTLKDHIARNQNFGSELDVCRTIQQLSSALSYIHEKEIIHRDLKPANILSGNDEYGSFNFKLADFGISKQLVMSNKTENGKLYTTTVVGTPIYMSPEIYRDQKYGISTDIWSLGVVISFICNQGKHLFTSKDDVVKWDGSKCPIDEKKYSTYLCKMSTNIMNPIEGNRLTANKIVKYATHLIKIMEHQTSLMEIL